MKNFVIIFMLVAFCNKPLGADTKNAKAGPDSSGETTVIKQTIQRILTEDAKGVLQPEIKQRLVDDLLKPVTAGGKPSMVDVPYTGAAWEFFQEGDQVRAVDSFMQGKEADSFIVTAELRYHRKDGRLLRFELRLEPCITTDKPKGTPLKVVLP